MHDGDRWMTPQHARLVHVMRSIGTQNGYGAERSDGAMELCCPYVVDLNLDGQTIAQSAKATHKKIPSHLNNGCRNR